MLEWIINLLQGGILQPLYFTTYGAGQKVTTVADVLIVAALLTVLFRFLRRTRATNVIWGFLLVLAAIVVARILNLATVNLVLTFFFILLIIAIPMVFQPELRRGLERLGRRGPFGTKYFADLSDRAVHEIVEAVEAMQEKRHGALIVLERQTGLSEFVENGVEIKSDIYAQLLETIFTPGSPLHDGAVIVREGMIAAAACTLPLSDGEEAAGFGTRHRAALGISETSDAAAIVVSEENAAISLAFDGHFVRISAAHELEKILRSITRTQKKKRKEEAKK